MKALKIITPILIAVAMSTFTACTDSSSSNTKANTGSSYLINATESRDVPLDTELLAQSEETKVKITRDIEADMMNVYVIIGSVEVTEALE